MIVLDRYSDLLATSDLQLALSLADLLICVQWCLKKLSLTMLIIAVLYTALKLDATKAFDRVEFQAFSCNYVKTVAASNIGSYCTCTVS